MRCTPGLLRSLVIIACLSTLASAAPGCAPTSRADVALAEGEIINGTRETGYPEVVAIYALMGAGGGLCTGTVIGPYAILTAKHCVFSENPDGSYTAVPPASFRVIETDDITAGTGEIHYVHSVRTTPGTNIDSDVSNGNDIAILILREPIAVAPRVVATTGPSIGETVTAVGFGRHSATIEDSAGVKYSALMRVEMLGTYQIQAGTTGGAGGGWTCQGDSGGPLIDPAGNVTGITSYGAGTCRIDYSVFVRVRAHGALINDALAFVPPCTPSGEICNGFDDDCDGMADDGIGCVEPGNPCTDSAECLMGECEMVGSAMLCTRGCFPDSPIDCPTGLYCEVTGCSYGRCVPGSRGTMPDGAPCTADTECASGHCPTLRAGRYCGTACCPTSGVYCAGETAVCDLIPGTTGAMVGAGACVPPELAMGPRPFGSPCAADADCASMDCAMPGLYCTQPCDPSMSIYCPVGYHCGAGACVVGDLQPPGGPCSTASDCRDGLECFEATCATPCDPAMADTCTVGTTCEPEGPGGADLCVRPGAALGEDCMVSTDCRSAICATVCTTLCDTVACPTGYDCLEAGESMACFPVGFGRTTVVGGCAATPGASRGSVGVIFVLAALALVLVRSRRR